MELAPQNIKEGNSFFSFRNKGKKSIPKNYPRCLCKTYIAQTGYI